MGQADRRIRITKTFSFEMAHALFGYDGPCKNIHGHSYELAVTLTGKTEADPSNPKYGMVIDFSDLKRIVKERVINEYDHALVLNRNSPHKELAEGKSIMEKIIFTAYQPTCENLLLDFVQKIKAGLPKHTSLHHLKLKETASSYAEWYAEDNP